MTRKDIAYYFLSSAKSNGKRVKITDSEKGVKKGYIQELELNDQVITVVIEEETFVIDLNVSEVRTSWLDPRVIHVDGNVSYKLQLS